MSNIIKFEKAEKTGAAPLLLMEFETGVTAALRLKKEKELFSRDNQDVVNDKDFKPGGFSFTIDRGEKEREYRGEAESYLEEIKRKAENIETEAYLRGVEQGSAAGREEMKRETTAATLSLVTALSEVKKIKQGIFADSEKDILDLVLLIAKKVIRREIEDKKTVVSVICAAVDRLIAKDEITIKINPDDMKSAEGLQEELKREKEGLKGITLEADALITKGGCVIETSFGSVDARIEPQIEEIEKALRESVKNEK